jgi:7-cyano-7-deazaguanine synthase in queuosine biosynthesis
MGGQDKVTVSNWFADTTKQVTNIKIDDGQKIDARLSQRIQTMSVYSAHNPVVAPTAVSQATSDSALQTAIAAAWHS